MAGRYVALLRGINVGRNKRIAMAELRALMEKQGFREVRTLLNSGNAVFTAARPSSNFGALVERGILETKGFSCRVTVLSADEVTEIIAQNPLGRVATDPSRLLVSVLAEPADRKKLLPLTREKWDPEAFGVGGRASYLWCPEGIIDSRIAKAIDKVLGDGVTARNWSTMQKLHAMLTDPG